MRSHTLGAPLACAAVSLGLFCMLHARGITIDPDGWAYWQGAVSIADGAGYRYFSGNPIIHWPPLYAIYLAAFVLLSGSNGATLIVANAILIFLQGYIWCFVFIKILSEGDTAVSPRTLYALPVALGVFIALSQQDVLADNLKYVFVPMMILATWNVFRSRSLHRLWQWSAICIVIACFLVLTHNNSIVFVVTGGILILIGLEHRWWRSAISVCVVIAPMIVALVIRHALGQAASHTIGISAGQYTPAEYVVQLIVGLGGLSVPGVAGQAVLFMAGVAAWIFALAILLVRKQEIRFLVSYAIISVFLTFMLFNVVWIRNEIIGRFTMILPLTLIGIMAFHLGSKIIRALFIYLIAIAILRTGTAAYRTTKSWEELGFPVSWIPWEASVSRSFHASHPIEIGGQLFVPPIGFEEPAR
jgi:hypothetical protein